MKRRDIALAAALLPFASIFAGSTAFAADAGNLKKLRVGVTAGPAAEILEQVVPLAKAKGLDIQIFEFQDYIQPNAALDSGDLDANIFQTIPFMEQTIKDRGYHLSVAGKGFTLPMAFYSKKVKSFDQAPKGATVGIPNDRPWAAARFSCSKRAALLSCARVWATRLQCSILLKIPKISSSLNSKPLSCRIRSMT